MPTSIFADHHSTKAHTFTHMILKFTRRAGLTIAMAICVASPAVAQVAHGGTPYSFINDLPGAVPVTVMGPVNVQALLASDEAERRSGIPRPERFGYAFEVDLDLARGRWTDLQNGDRVWRTRIIAPSAVSLNLIFDEFYIPEGGSLFLYNDDKTDVRGAFTSANNKAHGKFSTAPMPGAAVTLEFYEPLSARSDGRLSISRVVHGYRDIFSNSTPVETAGYGQSLSCNININCPEGSGLQSQKRSVALITLGNGDRICTGSLVNNVRNNLVPYFVTADHCLVGDVATWVFIFNYESPTCANQNVSTNQSISGATLRAQWQPTDFALLQLSKRPPVSYNTYYIGWSAALVNPQSSAVIHHPSGDIKKIALSSYPSSPNTSTLTWWPSLDTSPPGSHWVVGITQGTTQPGSSGSALFDQNGRMVGQLHGGYLSCAPTTNYFGRTAISWEGGGTNATRLRTWLDPDNTGALVLDGRIGPSLTGNITGDSFLQAEEVGEWVAHASGGFGGYTYEWTYQLNGDGGWYIPFGMDNYSQSWSTYFCSASLVTVGVYIFSHPESIFRTRDVYINNSNPNCVDGPLQWGLIADDEEELPAHFVVGHPAPNPASDQTHLTIGLPAAMTVEIRLYDVAGREVAPVGRVSLDPGYHRLLLDTAQLPSGVYIFRVSAGGEQGSGRFTILR